MSGTEIPTKDDIEQKISDNDLSQEDVDQINKLSADKKGAKLLSEVFDKQENRDKITQLINNDFISCSLDKQTVNVWYKFKNSINNPKVNKDGAFGGLIQTLEKKIGEFEGKINENDIKVTKETQEKLNKEQSQKELTTYLNIMPGKEDDIKKMADGLFESNEGRFNQLFDKDFRDDLTPAQQTNLTKYVQTYLDDNTIVFENIQFLSTIKDKVPDGDTTHRQSEKFPVGTNMIRLTTNTNAEIVFGTQDQAQSRISDAYIKEHPDKITELGDQIANTENKDITNEYIVNELNEKGSYVTLGKIIENKPETINKLLSNGFIESLMKSGENYKTKLEEANKKIREENLKDPNLKKPELTDTGLKSILDQQRDGYLNVINNAVLNIMKQPNITTSSPERTMFQSYMQSCNKDPRVLGATVDQRIASWNNIANRYKGFQDKNKVFFTDVISSSLPDLANRKNNTELSLHKAINNDFNALWIHIKGEGNEKYGLKAQMKSLFEGFKDKILMIAEFRGFDKEKIMHRCGFNKELKDQMTKFFKEKYELTGDQIKDINKLSTDNKDLVNDIKTVAKNGATEDGKTNPFADSKDAIIAFRNSTDIKDTYLKSLEKITPSGDFIKTLIVQYNATQKNENNHINYLDYVTKVNKNGKDNFEPTPGKREELIKNYGEKLRNLDFIWDNIATASGNLAAMTAPDRNGKGSESKTPEMAGMVIENIQADKGANTNEDMLLGISYYLSSMIIGGHDRLEYTISENNEVKPTENKDVEVTKAPDKVEAIATSMKIKSDYIDTAKTTDTKITLSNKANPVSINAIFDDFAKAPAGLKINGQDYSKKGDTYVDAKNNPVKIKEGTTIESMEADKLAKLIVNNTISTVSAIKDKDKLPEIDYTAQVTKPIFDLFTNKNTYDYMHQNDKEDATIKEAKTFDDLMMFSYNKFKPANSTTPFVHLDNIKEVIIKKKEESVNNKITFEVKTDLPTPRIFTIDVGGKFEEIKKDKTPEKNTTTVDYTSINTLRTSLGYVEKGKIPPNYTKKLMTELLKVDTTEDKQDMIIKEIVRTKLAEGNKIQDISTSQKGTKILDTTVYEPETGEFNTTCDIIKTGDKDIEINIENGKGKKFTIKTTIDDITKPIA